MLKSFKEIYGDTWGKHSVNTQKAVDRIRTWFPDPILEIIVGHGAIDSGINNDAHVRSEPDIYLQVNNEVLLGIEITGSDRIFISKEKPIWLCDHKYRFMESVDYPCCFWLYYRNRQPIIPFEMVEKYATDPMPKYPRGFLEHYREYPTEKAKDVLWLKGWIFRLLRIMGVV